MLSEDRAADSTCAAADGRPAGVRGRDAEPAEWLRSCRHRSAAGLGAGRLHDLLLWVARGGVHRRGGRVAIVLNDIPLDALAAELSTTRNTICKTMFDARRKLRAALAASGYLTLSGDAAGEVPANADPGRRS